MEELALALGIIIAVLWLVSQSWFWLFASFFAMLGSFFALIASIVTFNIVAALIFFVLTAVFGRIFTAVAEYRKNREADRRDAEQRNFARQ